MSLSTALTDLQSKIGTETRVSDWTTITQEQINQFAEATGDHQWIHVDIEKANNSPFGSTIAHGFLTLSLIPFLAGSGEPDAKPRYEGVKMGINYGLNKVRFPNPVKVGSQVRSRTELVSVEEVKGNGLQVVNKVTIEIDGVNKPACVAETVSRMYF
ncbi:MAG: MaoC family dehydratase [Chloroflexota bacterium]